MWPFSYCFLFFFFKCRHSSYRFYLLHLSFTDVIRNIVDFSRKVCAAAISKWFMFSPHSWHSLSLPLLISCLTGSVKGNHFRKVASAASLDIWAVVPSVRLTFKVVHELSCLEKKKQIFSSHVCDILYFEWQIAGRSGRMWLTCRMCCNLCPALTKGCSFCPSSNNEKRKIVMFFFQRSSFLLAHWLCLVFQQKLADMMWFHCFHDYQAS